jgi:hypothetical protein
MRPNLTAGLLATALAACVVVETPPPPPPVASAAQAAPPAPRPAPAGLSEREAVAKAFDYARDRDLRVDRVVEARLDANGRWLVELRGQGDRARMLIDARDGRLLKGQFRETDADLGE